MPDSTFVKDTIRPDLPNSLNEFVEGADTIFTNAEQNPPKDTNQLIKTAQPTTLKKVVTTKRVISTDAPKQPVPKVIITKEDSALYSKTFVNTFIDTTEAYCYHNEWQIPMVENGARYRINPTELQFVRRFHNVESFWVVGLFFVIASSIVWLRLFNTKYLELFFRSIVNFQLGNKLFRDHNTVVNKISLVLNIIFLFSISFFFLLVTKEIDVLHLHNNSGINYILLLSLFSGVILSRILLLKLIGWIFSHTALTNEYLFNILLTYKITGIVFIPLVIAAYYLPNNDTQIFNYFGISLIIIMLFIRFLKGVRIILRSNALIFYIVLYLCTLELLPLMVLVKSIINVGVLGS